MRALLRSTALAAIAAASTLAIATQRAEAQAYPVDCAILLCLSHSWPASAECSHARAVFIRRITPWPVEPPLQIWRCPMGAAETGPASEDVTIRFARMIEDLQRDPGHVTIPADDGHGLDDDPAEIVPAVLDRAVDNGASIPADMLHRVQEGAYINEDGRADIDISDPVFDFVRSIRVYDIEWSQSVRGRNSGDLWCDQRRDKVRIGTYGLQGDFRWSNADVGTATALPWLGFTTRPDGPCPHRGGFRGVGVEWTDYEGHHGYEVVRY